MKKPLPQLPDYTLERQLGSGGFGTTYLARQRGQDQLCVVKQLSFERLQDWKSLELFEREAKVLAQLNHPRIPRFLDYQSQTSGDTQQLFLVHSYVEGQSLQALVEQGRHFSEAEVLQLALEVARILVYLQDLKPPLIHRDLKPSNLIVAGEQVYLIDFGAVKDHLNVQTQGGSTVVGTFGYMAPEQFQGRANCATDIYALGACLLYALTHKQPHQFNTRGLKLDFRPHTLISRGFAQILEKMLEPSWEERYPHAAALLHDLEALKAGRYPQPSPEPENLAMDARPAYTKAVIVAVVSSLILGGIGLAFRLYQPGISLQEERFNEIKNKLENVYQETHQAEYGPLSEQQKKEIDKKLNTPETPGP